MNGRVKLQYSKHQFGWRNRDLFPPQIRIIECPPFIIKGAGCMVHRPRSGSIFASYADDSRSHWAGDCWCGQQWLSRRDSFAFIVPGRSLLCATCEARAIGAGQLDSHKINGRMVKFSPRSL